MKLNKGVVLTAVTICLAGSSYYFWTEYSKRPFPNIREKFRYTSEMTGNSFEVAVPPGGDFKLLGIMSDRADGGATPQPRPFDVHVKDHLSVVTLGTPANGNDQNGAYVNLTVNSRASDSPDTPNRMWFHRLPADFSADTNWPQIRTDILAANRRFDQANLIAWLTEKSIRDELIAGLTAITALITGLSGLVSAFKPIGKKA